MTPIPPPSVRLGRVRGAPFGALAILAIATACASGSGAVAGGGSDGDTFATPEARLADRVLTASGIESVIDARARAFTRQVSLLAG
ncbi:MAG: hypothetical protein AMS19_11330, partial [Gemmatimonas sp. SG8_23]